MIMFLCVKVTIVLQGVTVVGIMYLHSFRIVTLVIGIHVITVRRCLNARMVSNIIDYDSLNKVFCLASSFVVFSVMQYVMMALIISSRI